MLKLENYSLKRRMQMVAMLGIAFLVLLAGLFWYMGASGMSLNEELKIMAIVTVVVSIVLYAVATYIGNFGMLRANTLVAGIQNIKKGDLTQKVAIAGKSDFSWMAFELDSARKNVSNLVHTLIGGVSQLEKESNQMSAISKQTVEGVLKQQSEISQVATAMNEMAVSVQEVARTAANTAEAARNADNEAQAGQ